MKASESKTASSHARQNNQSAERPFFQKDGQQSFFSETAVLDRSPFGGREGQNNGSFFSPSTIQPKLKIGQPNDKFEKEADQVADQAVQRIAQSDVASESASANGLENSAPPAIQRVSTPISTIQRKCSECGAEMEEQQSEEASSEETVQRKPIFESSAPPEDDSSVQRKCAACAAEEKVQQKNESGGESSASPNLESRLNSSKGSGRPLPEDTRTQMEGAIGADFSGVRVHTGSGAVQMNKDLGAKAFTHGSDVYFNSGQYDTENVGGKKLLAHELVHTVQQGGANIRRDLSEEGVEFKADKIFKAVEGWGTDEDTIFDTITGLTPSDALSLKSIYSRKYKSLREGRDLTQDLDYEFEDKKNTYRAYKLLHHKVKTSDEALTTPTTPYEQRILVDPPKKKIPPSTEVTYKMEIGKSIFDTVKYQWWVYNDPNSVFEFKKQGVEKPNVVKGPSSQVWEKALWAFGGKHKVVCMVQFGDNEPSFFEFFQIVEVDPLQPSEGYEEPVFEPTDKELDATEEGKAIEEYGIVQVDDGTNLWPHPDRSEPSLGLLPQNTRVFIDRNVGNGWVSVFVEGHQRGKSIPVPEGTMGYISAVSINKDLPDPGAWLYRIEKDGQGALSVAMEVFKDNFKPSWGKDYRYLVNVLAIVNEAKERRYFYKNDPDDSWKKTKTKKGQIWVPGIELIDTLHGQISSGSISYEVLTTIRDVAIGVAAFIVGLLHGAIMSIADIFIGIYDLGELIVDIIIKLFKGTLISDAKSFWDDISNLKMDDILEMVGAKWNHPNIWDRWKFRGYVIGYIIVEILLMYFSVGIVTAIKWVGRVGKFGKIGSYIAKLSKVQKLVKAAEALKGKGIQKVRATLKAAHSLSEYHGWAGKALRIPISILQRLSKLDIEKLRKLPQWARERFARLSDKVKLHLLGCSSPCKVDVNEIEKALKLAGKGGKKLNTAKDVLDILPKGLNKFKISQKLKKNSSLLKAIQEAGLTDKDFAKLADFLTPEDANPAQAYRTFTRYLTSVVPAKTGKDITALNKILAAIVKVEPRRGAALKGAMFEQWVALHVPQLASLTYKRITFNLRTLLKKTKPPYRRTVDIWTEAQGIIWDMKHTFSKVPNDQALDYLGLIGKVAPDQNIVKGINYLFPTKAAAELNKHLSTTYKFGVYYIDNTTNALVKL